MYTLYRLKKLRAKDLSQLHKEKALYNLLTVIVEVREKLSQPEYTNSATDEETKSIMEKLSEVPILLSLWLTANTFKLSVGNTTL